MEVPRKKGEQNLLFIHVKPSKSVALRCDYLGFRNEWVIWDFLLFWQELDKMLADTPPVWKGSSNLFRNLRERGEVTPLMYYSSTNKSTAFKQFPSMLSFFERPSMYCSEFALLCISTWYTPEQQVCCKYYLISPSDWLHAVNLFSRSLSRREQCIDNKHSDPPCFFLDITVTINFSGTK